MRRAAPAFEILMLAPVRRFFPEPRQRLNGGWRRARVCTPPRISPSCPFQDRSTNAGAVIARQIGHDLLSGRSDPLPTLLAAFMQIPCTGGSSRSLQCRCPFSVFTRHTNGCISVSGYSLRKVQVKRIPFSLFSRTSTCNYDKSSKTSQKLHQNS